MGTHDFPYELAAVAPGGGNCPNCGHPYNPDADLTRYGCHPPTSDSPVPGHHVDIPAWCAVRGAYVWVEAGRLVADR